MNCIELRIKYITYFYLSEKSHLCVIGYYTEMVLSKLDEVNLLTQQGLENLNVRFDFIYRNINVMNTNNKRKFNKTI